MAAKANLLRNRIFDPLRSSLAGFCSLRVSSSASIFFAYWGVASDFAFSIVRDQLYEINRGWRCRLLMANGDCSKRSAFLGRHRPLLMALSMWKIEAVIYWRGNGWLATAVAGVLVSAAVRCLR